MSKTIENKIIEAIQKKALELQPVMKEIPAFVKEAGVSYTYGPNGLLRHVIDGHCVKHGEGTWDCIEGEFS